MARHELVILEEDNMKYSPKYFKDFKKKYPKIAQDFDTLAQNCHRTGPLDAKVRRLVKLAIAVGIGSEGEVQSHVIQALGEDITPDEIRHTILLSLTTAGFPQMIASMTWAEEVMGKTK